MNHSRIRNIDDDTDNKGTSKLTYEVNSEIGQTSEMELFAKSVSS